MPSLVHRVSSNARTLPRLDGHELQLGRRAGPYQDARDLADDGRVYLPFAHCKTALGIVRHAIGRAAS